jgi:hypothetical protein
MASIGDVRIIVSSESEERKHNRMDLYYAMLLLGITKENLYYTNKRIDIDSLSPYMDKVIDVIGDKIFHQYISFYPTVIRILSQRNLKECNFSVFFMIFFVNHQTNQSYNNLFRIKFQKINSCSTLFEFQEYTRNVFIAFIDDLKIKLSRFVAYGYKPTYIINDIFFY